MIDSIFTYEFPKEEIDAFNYLSSIDDPNAYLMLEAMYKKAEKPRFNFIPMDDKERQEKLFRAFGGK